jgi:hypothetical protein
MILEGLALITPFVGYGLRKHAIKLLGPGLVQHTYHKASEIKTNFVATPRGIMPVMYSTETKDHHTIDIQLGQVEPVQSVLHKKQYGSDFEILLHPNNPEISERYVVKN